jgi:hypothetical protein
VLVALSLRVHDDHEEEVDRHPRERGEEEEEGKRREIRREMRRETRRKKQKKGKKTEPNGGRNLFVWLVLTLFLILLSVPRQEEKKKRSDKKQHTPHTQKQTKQH